MLLRRYDRKGVEQKEEVKQLHEQGLNQVETGERRDETSVTVTTPEEAEEDADMPKYVKPADRSAIVEKAEANKAEDYSTYSREDLEGVKNDDLKEYLDGKNVEYASNAIKKDLINAILGE